MFTKNHKIIGGLGWYGMVAIVFAYALNYFEYTGTESVLYAFLNISGALGIIVDSWYHKAWQSVVLNAFWVGIALMALVRAYLK